MVDHIVFADLPGAVGGQADTQTAVNRVVNGHVVRTATDSNEERLHWNSWLVEDLQGQTGHIEIVDPNTGGWGHINAVQSSFDDRPAD